MSAPIKLDPEKPYKTRSGLKVTRITRKPFATSESILDGFPWQVFYLDANGREQSFWASASGKWSNNTRFTSELDLFDA